MGRASLGKPCPALSPGSSGLSVIVSSSPLLIAYPSDHAFAKPEVAPHAIFVNVDTGRERGAPVIRDTPMRLDCACEGNQQLVRSRAGAIEGDPGRTVMALDEDERALGNPL